MAKEITGVCAAVCSPFDDSGNQFDQARYTALIDEMIDVGMHGFVLCGGTGEFAYLSTDERRMAIELGCRHIGDRAHKIAHTSTVNLSDGIEMAKFAEGAGADALMILPPYFEGPAEDGVEHFYLSIADAVSIDIVAYNIPVHSGFDVTPELFSRLLKHPNINYIKDSTGDLTRIQELVATGGKVLNGGDPITFYALVAGCVGCIWGSCNVFPAETVQLYEKVAAGDLTGAREIWSRIGPANIHFWNNPYNPTIKAGAKVMGRDLGPCRQPVQPLTAEAQAALEAVLAPLKA